MWHPQPIKESKTKDLLIIIIISWWWTFGFICCTCLSWVLCLSAIFSFIIVQLFLPQLLNFSHFYPSSSHPHPTGGEWMSSCVGLTHDTEPCWKTMQYVTNCQLLGSLFLGLILFINLMHFVLISSLVNYKSHPGIFHSNTCRYKEIFGYLLPFSRVMELNLQNRYSWGCYW